jgi:membrane protein YdbS with pleckstrin-like domain
MDSSNIDFAAIWQQQKVAQSNMDELKSKLKKYHKTSIQKLIVFNILLIATAAGIFCILYFYQPQHLTTKIGIVLTILAMATYLFAYNKQLSHFKQIDETQTNSRYLKSLAALKTKQKYLQTKMLSIYYLLLSSGIGLYTYEYTLKMTVFWAYFAYVITLTWIGFNWFYIRPKTVKKQETNLNELIGKLENLNKQLHEK